MWADSYPLLAIIRRPGATGQAARVAKNVADFLLLICFPEDRNGPDSIDDN